MSDSTTLRAVGVSVEEIDTTVQEVADKYSGAIEYYILDYLIESRVELPDGFAEAVAKAVASRVTADLNLIRKPLLILSWKMYRAGVDRSITLEQHEATTSKLPQKP